jgi:AmmeMemoRadiSam system protein B
MAGPRVASVRKPAVAGLFYPAGREECLAEARALLRINENAMSDSGRWSGAIVPHAGWACSGAIAGESIGTLAQQGPVDLVVVFGAIHTPLHTDLATLDAHARWAVPGGESSLPAELQRELTEGSELFVVDERFHEHEHAVEVELPLIQLAWPDAQVLPIEVPVTEDAIEIGRATARLVNASGLRAVYLASSDLTHYGPNYRFAPVGVGAHGLAWAKENDRRLLDLVTDMRVEAIVPEVRDRLNACGPGAIAAMMAACREIGARGAQVLRHQNSCEALEKIAPQPPDNAVGYAAVLVG